MDTYIQRVSLLQVKLLKESNIRKKFFVKIVEIYPFLHPTSPVQLSIWERLGNIWLLHFCCYIVYNMIFNRPNHNFQNNFQFLYSLISQISKFTKTKVKFESKAVLKNYDLWHYIRSFV